MANMSYCRFRNTNSDLRDCLNAVDAREKTGDEELGAANDMFDFFLGFCMDLGIIEDYDMDQLGNVLDEMRK